MTTVLPTGATASFSPNPVIIPSSANTGTSTLTISTTAATPVNLLGTSFTVRGTNLAGGSNTAQATGTLKVSSGNTAPTATISLNDHSPKTNDVLTATATRTDADGDPVTLTYVWKNGTTVVKTTPNT
ncbi:MAG: hypothetical protein ACRD2A_11585, partial [Vicinamibacterales bacterium]